MSLEDALIDIEGLKFRRQASSSAKFYHLEMQLRKQKGNSLYVVSLLDERVLFLTIELV